MTAIDTSTEAVERLLDGVTPGPWRIKDCTTDGYRCINYYQEIWNDETDILVTTEVTRAHNDGGAKNMRFIAAARDLVPALLKERDEARAALAASQPTDPVTNAGGRQPVKVKPQEPAPVTPAEAVKGPRIVTFHTAARFGVCIGGRWDGWVMIKHPDGYWVSHHKPDPVDPSIPALRAVGRDEA